MYWRNVKRLNIPVIDKGACWVTNTGECIDWNGEESREAHEYLKKVSRQDIKLTMEALEVLKKCTIDGMVVKLPSIQLDRADYMAVKNKLELIGGKWKGGKIGGFVFQEDPTELLRQVSEGHNRNIKKEFQFFGTPNDLADELVELADIQPEDEVCEPSAGQGAIVNAIHRLYGIDRKVWGYELMPLNQTFLIKIDSLHLISNDFLKSNIVFDKIVANPPFTKNQDIDHILHMYSCLKPGGRLVSMSSNHWRNSDKKKERNFRDWLESVNAEIIDVPMGAFKESGTNIATCIVVIDKLI